MRLEVLLKAGPDLRGRRFLRLKASRWRANFISPDEALEGILRREPIREPQRLNDALATTGHPGGRLSNSAR
jgi:hypothetical protein